MHLQRIKRKLKTINSILIQDLLHQIRIKNSFINHIIKTIIDLWIIEVNITVIVKDLEITMKANIWH